LARGSGTATRGRKWGRGRGNGTFIRVGAGCDCGGTISASSIGPAGGSDVILLAKDAGESDQARSSLSPSRAAGRISNGHLVSITPRSRCTSRDQSDGPTEASSAVAKSAKMLATMTVVRLPCILATLCSKLLSTQISQLARSGLIHLRTRPTGRPPWKNLLGLFCGMAAAIRRSALTPRAPVPSSRSHARSLGRKWRRDSGGCLHDQKPISAHKTCRRVEIFEQLATVNRGFRLMSRGL